MSRTFFYLFIFILSPDIKSCNVFTVLVKPSEAGGKGEECFGGRKEQSCGVPHPGE